ncbi:MAG: imidazole glycerol phosphate synthase, glutamine amidotransferase subunit [Bacteroidota bacterium]|jgi:glutamine amidotransferase
MTIIIDYNLGNPKSIKNMLGYLFVDAQISSDRSEIAKAERLILPGVGHFQHGMEQLEQLGLIEVLNKVVLEDKKPILGICLGMQLLTKHSEEGNIDGLGFIDAQTIKFNLDDPQLKIPHMGWNTVQFKKESNLRNEIIPNPRYYFVHSYYVECNNTADILCTTNYGVEFVSGFQHNNIFGVQFHPEKSHTFGMELLDNFCKL